MDETKFKAALEEVIKNQRNPNELGGVYKINKDGSLGGKIFDFNKPKDRSKWNINDPYGMSDLPDILKGKI